jgi:hypothetical protein
MGCRAKLAVSDASSVTPPRLRVSIAMVVIPVPARRPWRLAAMFCFSLHVGALP